MLPQRSRGALSRLTMSSSSPRFYGIRADDDRGPSMIMFEKENSMRRFASIARLIACRLIPQPALRFLQDRFVYRPVIRQKKISVDAPPLFDTVFFEVRSRCNGRCRFCAASVGNDTRPDLSMRPEIYEKVLRDLANIDFQGRIAYHNNNDPLVFKDLHLFVDRARKMVPKAYIQILSNGRALTLEKADALVRAGIDELSINYYNDDLRAELPRVFHEVPRVVLLKYFSSDQVEIKGISQDRVNPKAKFRYYVRRRLENEKLTSRAGTAPNKKIPDPRPRGFCQYPFTQFIVTADGRVPMCCADFNILVPVGDATRQSVMEIWHGEALRRVRGVVLTGNRQSLPTCRPCDFYGVKRPPDTLVGRCVYHITL